MSSYLKVIHYNGSEHEVAFLDDYFGKHQYGVKFLDGRIEKEEDLDYLYSDSNPTTSWENFEEKKEEKEAGDFKKFSLYALRWQCSSPILFACIYFLDFSELWETIIANFIGACIFYWVDKKIFKQ